MLDERGGLAGEWLSDRWDEYLSDAQSEYAHDIGNQSGQDWVGAYDPSEDREIRSDIRHIVWMNLPEDVANFIDIDAFVP